MVALNERICPRGKIRVLGKGSGNGVDALERFNPERLSVTVREETRSELGIPGQATVIGFVGRVVKEKGIAELEEAWHSLRDSYPEAYLLIVGPFETQDPLPAHSIARLQKDRRVVLTGLEWNTAPLYAAMDIVVLPTYREGFPNVPLEAASMELPVVATNVPGCIDAVEDGKTGILVPPRDHVSLAGAIRLYLNDPTLRLAQGKAGRERVLRDFRPEVIWKAIYDQYDELLRGRSNDRLKRIFDCVAAAFGLVVLSPVLVVIGLAVWARLGRPILFRQVRPGYLGRPFVIYKFRTMVKALDKNGDPLPDHSRITPLGNFLRRTSLDELPELWNVLKGEMSLVGPRPLLTEYLRLYTSIQSRRHEVRPGVTGWAQIHGRNATTWEKRLALDVWYVDNRTLLLDLSIILRTLLKVLLREGINQDGEATMERFYGSAV
jgi:lipopolysaccharide/colanic/teichoic acid biosynthesis glycosyltransferase